MSGSLVVVGTGIQWGGQTTLAAQHAIQHADRVLYAVAEPWAARWIQSLNPSAESLPYGQGETPRRAVYLEMVERILGELRRGLKVCAVFYGHPGVLTTASHEVIRQARREGLSARMLPGVSFLDCMFADLALDPGRDGCHVYEATDFLLRRRSFDGRSPMVLCQVGMIGNLGFYDEADTDRIQRGLTVLAEVLGRCFSPDHEIVLYEASVHPLEPPRRDRVALRALKGARVSDLTSIYLAPVEPAPIDLLMLARLQITSLPGTHGGAPHPAATP